MTSTPILPFISDEDLINETRKVIEAAIAANNSSGDSLYSNVVDPFSAIFDSLQQDMTLTEWLANERTRQIGKTIQNKLGTFHQEILGCIPGWRSLGVGQIVDLVNDERKIVAEVKTSTILLKAIIKKTSTMTLQPYLTPMHTVGMLVIMSRSYLLHETHIISPLPRQIMSLTLIALLGAI